MIIGGFAQNKAASGWLLTPESGVKMLRILIFVLCCLGSINTAFAVSPYITGDKLSCRGVVVCVNQLKQKLQTRKFQVIGVHYPQGLPQYAVVVVTDKRMLETIRYLGGDAIIGAGIRIGVRSDGVVTYINPDYWYRAYFRRKFEFASAAVKGLEVRLATVLGSGQQFGGDVPAIDLTNYRYMIGMERFDSDKNELASYPNFDTAVKTVRNNLARRVAGTREVYEVVMGDRKIAVFGVAMNDLTRGEGWWVNKIGADHIAALPWEIYIVNGKVSALYGRYRTALGWPTLGMGEFISIRDHPDSTLEMLIRVAGGKQQKWTLLY